LYIEGIAHDDEMMREKERIVAKATISVTRKNCERERGLKRRYW